MKMMMKMMIRGVRQYGHYVRSRENFSKKFFEIFWETIL